MYILLLSITLVTSMQYAQATDHRLISQTVGITTSLACQKMHQHNITTTCPSYQELLATGLDTSLPGSGEFLMDDNGMFNRGVPKYQKLHQLYRFNDYHIIIDPSYDLAQRIKMITISTSLPTYVIAGESEKINNKRILHESRYVQDCFDAIITSDDWERLLADTIYYLRNGCTKTVFETTLWIEDPKSEFNKETSKKFKYDKWLKESKEKCKEICKEY